MLGLLPDWLRERIQDQLDRIIHASMALTVALTVAFTGMSLEDLVLIIPALVSVTISILAWIARRQDRKRRIEIYQQEERKRTEAMQAYLESLNGKATTSSAVMAQQAVSKASKMGVGELDAQH